MCECKRCISERMILKENIKIGVALTELVTII